MFTPLAWFVPRGRGEPRSILLVEPYMLGDAVLLSVMLDPLRERFPAAEIHLLVQPLAAPLYRDDPRVAAVHETVVPWANKGQLPRLRAWRRFLGVLRGLRRERFDLGVDLRGDVRSQALLVLAGCRERLGSTNYLCSSIRIRGLLLTHSVGDVPLQHRTVTNLALCRLAGCEVPAVWTPPDPHAHGLPLGRSAVASAGASAAVRAAPVPAASPRPPLRVLVHTGGGWSFKLWKEERWVALLRRLLDETAIEIALVGATGERERLERLRARLPAAVRITETDVPQLVEEIDRADVVVCLDSGPMHIASLKGKPVTALFGPGVLTLYRPLGLGSRVVHHQDSFPCAPCAQRACFCAGGCMDAITVDEAWNAFQQTTKAMKRPPA